MFLLRLSYKKLTGIGLYLSYHDRGNLEAVLGNWRQPDVEMTVVTDGSRILGLGDLGVNGMGIPVGKLALYTGCAGIHPAKTLPITLDLGTNNETFLNDPLYMGNRMKRISTKEEAEFMEELMVALNKTWPGYVLVIWTKALFTNLWVGLSFNMRISKIHSLLWQSIRTSILASMMTFKVLVLLSWQVSLMLYVVLVFLSKTKEPFSWVPVVPVWVSHNKLYNSSKRKD